MDISGPEFPTPRHFTRFKALATNEALHIGVWMDEPHLWATLTERDCVIFQDNDIEIFLDPDADTLRYVEIEMNALGTVWDLLLTAPYKKQGVPLDSWDFKGIETEVRLEGTLNDPTDEDTGWAAAFKLPWRSLKEVAGSLNFPPQPGDRWKLNLSRVQWDLEVRDGRYHKVPNTPEHNWVWSPMGEIDMHIPERWGWLEFVSATPYPSA